MLQNSKVAAVKIFGENLKRKDVDNSHSFSRATEVAHEFGARRRGPSDHCTNNAPAALRIFDTSCKTTFATQSPQQRTFIRHLVRVRTPFAQTGHASDAFCPAAGLRAGRGAIQGSCGSGIALGGVENVGSVTLRSPLINQSVHMMVTHAKARPARLVI